eukprot:752533-Hanusia_phi.AAC.3
MIQSRHVPVCSTLLLDDMSSTDQRTQAAEQWLCSRSLHEATQSSEARTGQPGQRQVALWSSDHFIAFSSFLQEFVTLFDFASTAVANGLNLEFESIIPEDKYLSQRALSESKMNRGAASPMTSSSYNDILDNKSEDTLDASTSICTL